MKTIALANQKSGVCKTTTAASLGIGLSRQGKKVLLIDADAQGNLTQMLGWPQPDEEGLRSGPCRFHWHSGNCHEGRK